MADSTPAITRRRFVTYFSSVGLSSTLLPGVLWARLQEERAEHITAAMLKDALAVAGLDFTDEARQQILNGVNQNLTRYADLRQLHIDPNIAPPLYYSPIVPGTRLDRAQRPFRTSATPSLRRPANLEDVAFWPLAHLAHLLKTRQVTSVELSRMYLDRLKRYNPILNFVVTFTDDLGMQQAQQADREIAAGKYRGPLHGIPWGCKDIIAVPGYPTQWGSGAFKGQVIDTEATVVRLLREAGAVLVAKLTTGELASGDQWFGGRTNSPWDPTEGSSGSSAGPASATAGARVPPGEAQRRREAQRRPGARSGEGARRHARAVRAAGDAAQRDRRNSRRRIGRLVRRVRPERTRQEPHEQGAKQRDAAEPSGPGGRVSAGAARARHDHASVRGYCVEVRRLHRALHQYAVRWGR